MPKRTRKESKKKLASLTEWRPSTVTRIAGSEYRQVVCPLCGRSASTKPIVKGQGFWDRLADFDPAKAFGVIQRAAGRGTLDVIGHFGPEGEPEIHAAIQGRIVAMLVEWLNKGWISPEDLLPVSSWGPGKPPKKPAPVAPVKAPTPTEAKKPPVGEEAPSKAKELYKKWKKAARPNAPRARTDLDNISYEYDVTDSQAIHDEYQALKRSDYEDAEEYAEERADAWKEFVDSLENIEKIEEEGAPEKPVPRGAPVTPEVTTSIEPGRLKNEYVIAAFRKGQRVGSVGITEGDDYIVFRLMQVDPSSRRVGVGTELVSAALRRAKLEGKVLLTGSLTEEGRNLFLGLEKKGLITLTEPAADTKFQRLSRYVIEPKAAAPKTAPKPTPKPLGKAKAPPPKRGVVQKLPPAAAEGAVPGFPVGRMVRREQLD